MGSVCFRGAANPGRSRFQAASLASLASRLKGLRARLPAPQKQSDPLPDSFTDP